MESPQEFIRSVSQQTDLSREQSAAAMEGIMNGDWTPAQIAAYLTALSMKGETLEEIVGGAQVMRAKAFSGEVQNRPLVDPVGSGGDGLRTINVSTLAGLIAAGAGASVAKHGNRAMSGQCGSADVLEGLGVELEIPAEDAIRGIDEIGFAFLFAPVFHQSMRHAIGPRREIGIPSIFNYLGPLTNPVAPEAQLVGVNQAQNTTRFTEVLIGLGCKHSMVVHGKDGMDEITNTGETTVVEQMDGKIAEYELTPENFGIERVTHEQLAMPDKEAAIRMGEAVLKGEAPGPHEDLVLLNAAATIYLGGKAASIEEGLKTAREVLRSGAAWQVVERVAAYTQSKKPAA
ncbi:MAG: anthranilate phosphoribosyltransferase [SAR324 cluster bacterium]|nr:anthranilate phosphoribosyltransferase [SAR324 cluster bacterium]